MASIPYIFSWDVTSAALDEAEIERSQAFARVCLGNYFNIAVHVKHQIISLLTHPCPQPPTAKPTFSPFFSADRSIILSSSQLFEDGPSYMRVHFPHPIIPRELMVQMMPEVITYAKNMLENYSPSSGLHYERGNFRLFKLVLDILVQKPYDEIYNMILEDSASLNATVESLDKVNLGGVAAKERCSICLGEFSDGMQVSALPCTHKYHQECINVWLETSYTCPLCRQPLVKLSRRDQRAAGDLKPVRMKKSSEI